MGLTTTSLDFDYGDIVLRVVSLLKPLVSVMNSRQHSGKPIQANLLATRGTHCKMLRMRQSLAHGWVRTLSNHWQSSRGIDRCECSLSHLWPYQHARHCTCLKLQCRGYRTYVHSTYGPWPTWPCNRLWQAVRTLGKKIVELRANEIGDGGREAGNRTPRGRVWRLVRFGRLDVSLHFDSP